MEPPQNSGGYVAFPFKIPIMNEAGRREVQRIMGRDENETRNFETDAEGRPILNLTPNHATSADRILKLMEYLRSITSMVREVVVEQYWVHAELVQNDTSMETVLKLLHDDDEGKAKPVAASPWSEMDIQAPPIPKAPRKVELCEENRIEIEVLHEAVDSPRQDGKFFLCRTLTPAINALWVDVVVEDPSGVNAAILRLANFTPPRYSKNVERGRDDFLGILPPGSFIAVKNPYREAMISTSTCVLLVTSDNPGDVMILTEKKVKELFPDLVWKGSVPGCSVWDYVGRTDAHDPQVMEALKRKGNEAFVYKRYTDALRCYDMALEYIGNKDVVGFVTIWSNKAAAFLGFRCFLKALECCDKALVRDRIHVKSIHRKVKALVGLGRCDEALNFLTNQLIEYPILVENEDLRNLGAKIPKQGTIPTLEKLLNPDSKLATFDDFTAEYLGPIQFRINSSSGRGVFATDDINPGDVILFQRTFAEVEGVIREYDRGNGQLKQLLGCFELTGTIANKIAFAPELGPEVNKLWAGQDMKMLNDNHRENRKVNMDRIKKIVDIHAKSGDKGSTSLTTKMEFVTHGCTRANIRTAHSSNWTLISATKFIKKGNELYNEWVDTSKIVDGRRKQALLNKIGMTCTCRLCLLDAADGPKIQDKAVNLVNRLKSIGTDFVESRQMLNQALEVVKELQKLRSSAPDLSLVMIPCDIRMNLCKALLFRRRYKEEVNLCKKVFDSEVAMNHSECALIAARSAIFGSLELKNTAKATEWAKQVKKYAVIIYGSPTASEAWLFGDLIELLSAAGIETSSFLDA